MITEVPRSMFYKLAKEVCGKEMVEELNEKVSVCYTCVFLMALALAFMSR